MKTASISQAKNHLSALIDAVKHGETVTITDRDRPVARLEPIVRGEDETDEACLARLKRAGIIHRGNSKAIRKILSAPPSELPPGVSVLGTLLEERRHGQLNSGIARRSGFRVIGVGE